MIATGVGNAPRVERPASGSQVEETEGAESRNGDDAAAGGNGWRTVPGDMTASRNAHIVAKSATTIRSNRPGNAAGVPVGTDSFTMKKDGGGREKIGAVVQEGTNSWTFVTTLVDGIATTVQKAREDMHETQRELRSGDIKIQPVDFDEFYKMDREGRHIFKDYAPRVFRSLRHWFGVDDETYMMSMLSKGVSEISTAETGSKSGQKFLISADGRYFIKTITKNECKFFRKTLPKYYLHVKEDRNTLLCRFFGMHRVKPGGMHLIVMCNIFDTDRIIHHRYDLKGSTVGRMVQESERLNATVIFKDLDFKEKLGNLRLGPERKKLLMDQMRSDAGFLQSIGVMDYSLLVGVHDRDMNKSKNPAKETVANLQKKIKRKEHLLRTGSLMIPNDHKGKTHTSTFQEDDGGWSSLQTDEAGTAVSGHEIFFLGIIDYLQYYNKKKTAENFFKGFRYDRREISVVPTGEYATRFLKFIDSIIS